ncbi:UDP-N-acetylglucosamine 1-carboxyvinyltransferase [Staphylospora marina]|uniref:UDP-N-acetylglucosamine 1-carboxyvinyltransferase n=1 Tax=Staphylospora marina TaxID=2490858 RepID=UPI000F5BC4ED|nr:UDP-N-acetylglucosamine 1-carboxyvinyltransferase [Staphylospora marina]
MGKWIIQGGKPLVGTVTISGSAKSALAMIPAALLADSPSVLENVPMVGDVERYIELLQELDATVSVDRGNRTLTIDPSLVPKSPVHIRHPLWSSLYLIGALLGRFGKVSARLANAGYLTPHLDQHLKGFEAMGANVVLRGDRLEIEADRLKGARIYLDVVSPYATINIMLAAMGAEGKTVIENAAKDPEVIDVATFLSAMGAEVKGAGTDVIRVEGNRRLKGACHALIPDRFEAGMWMIAAAATGGEVRMEPVIPEHLESVAAKLKEMGAGIRGEDEAVIVSGRKGYGAVDVKTHPYPGFPADLQPSFSSLLIRSSGTSLIVDNIFSRFHHAPELRKMGAKLKVEGRAAVIEGESRLYPTSLQIRDPETGVALLIAALQTEGISELNGTETLGRRLENLKAKLAGLGVRFRAESA